VGSPAYLATKAAPTTPQDILDHNCITLRLASSGALYAWELKKGSNEIQVRVEGQATFNGVYQMLQAAVSGCGLAFVPEELALADVEAGRLVRVMEDWCPVFPGLHVYYSSRRHLSRALSLIVEAVRHRG
jgi:DNA-binding transcriptional LysR family regulator